MRAIFAIILGFLMLAPVSDAFSACQGTGVDLTDGHGVVRHFDNAQAAIDAAKSGDRLVFGELPAKDALPIHSKSDLVLESNCSTIVDSIKITSSTGIKIRGFYVEAKNGNGITISDEGGAKNSNISLSTLIVEAYSMANHGIEIGEKSENITLENSIVRNFFFQGILIKPSGKNIKILASVIRGNGRNGILILDESEVELRDNTIVDNGSAGIRSTDAFFGVLIEKPRPGFLPSKVSITNNKIFFNLGALDKRLKSDIMGFDFLIASSANVSTYGRETSGFEKWNANSLKEVETKILNFLVPFSESEKIFLRNYATIVVLAIKGNDLGATNFAMIREQQMDQCLYAVENYRAAITDLIALIVGDDTEELASFVARIHRGDRELIAGYLPTFCDEFQQ